MVPEPLPLDPLLVVRKLLQQDRRVLLFGPPGIGKTTLGANLAKELAARGHPPACLAADPGSPLFGVPGALCLGRWRDDGWALVDLEALCSLDAARFRLPLVSAVGTLCRRVDRGTLLLDSPGVVRGVAAAELLEALVRTAGIDLVLVLDRYQKPLPTGAELASLGVEIAYLRASQDAHRPGKRTRARHRTDLWDHYLRRGEVHRPVVNELRVLGTPPRSAPEAWQGKQVAFLRQGRTVAMGEVVGSDGMHLHIRLPAGQRPTSTLLVRDACRSDDGLLNTGKPFAYGLVRYIPPPDVLPGLPADTTRGVRPIVHMGTATAALVNGVLGDPLLHLRLQQQRRSLLFDLGEGTRLPARIAHQTTDVFISHAHADHIGGFLWLLRSRMGETKPCRLYGPPGLAGHLHGFISGILWDRIGDRGPVFEVAELHREHLRRYRLQAGRGKPEPLGERKVEGGVLLEEEGFRIRATLLDHGVPVLAFAYQPPLQVKVRKECLVERGLKPGHWLTELKQRIRQGDYGARVMLPDGSSRVVEKLAAELTRITAGSKMVYATDFADTADNRRRLIALAADAHTLFCESTFLLRDREQARRTGHLTTRACGEIGVAAKVRHLIPFHFSRRYEDEPRRVYAEVAEVCAQTVIPKRADWRSKGESAKPLG